jgi:serine/threonine protein kinase
VRELAERAYFHLCLGLGRLLRSGKYSKVRIVDRDAEPHVRKQRSFYAPVLIWLSDPLVRVLDTGMRVLPQREWAEREDQLYRSLRSTAVRTEASGTVVLPALTGRTLAAWLDDHALAESARTRAIGLAVAALVDLHQKGFTHGDAMAENVMVDLDAGVANWFDFETVHESNRPLTWRRADDVRALVATCVLRASSERIPETVRLVVDAYGDGQVARLVATSFGSVWRRPLTFHLGQAGLTLGAYRQIGRVLSGGGK